MSVLLLLITLLAGLLRAPLITHTPPELFGDEVDVGYQAFSLLTTGRDLYNHPLPTYITSLSEPRAPLLMYMTVPSIAVFGNTTLGVRAPEIIFGTLAPWLVIALCFALTKSKSISLLAGFTLAILPWHVHYSRAAFEVVIMADFIMAGCALLLTKRGVLGSICLALAMYTYSTAVLFVPLLFIALWFLVKSVRRYSALITFAVMLIPFVANLVTGSASSRFSLISILNDNDQIKLMFEQRATDSELAGRVWHNKAQTMGFKFLNNYLQAFSTDFLFTRGDPTLRHGIGQMGVILPATAPLLLLGLLYLARRKIWPLLVWLVLAPIPSALTVDGGYHATRLFLLVPPLAIAIAAGWHQLALLTKSKAKNVLLVAAVAIPFMYQLGWYMHYYVIHYPVVSWQWWHVGFQDTFTSLAKYQNDYTRVFVNNTYEPALIRYLFYTNYSPKKFHQVFTLDQSQKNIAPGYDGFTLDNKVFFGSFSDTKTDITKRLLPGSLYVLSQRDDVGGNWDWRTSPPADVKVLDTITNPYDQPIFYLVTKTPTH